MTAASGVAPEATPDSLADLGLRAWLSPRRRFRQWWRLRLRPTDTQVLTQRNVYIVPTGAGLMWGLTIVVLLIASINYSLSLGSALPFLLAGSALRACTCATARCADCTCPCCPQSRSLQDNRRRWPCA